LLAWSKQLSDSWLCPKWAEQFPDSSASGFHEMRRDLEGPVESSLKHGESWHHVLGCYIGIICDEVFEHKYNET